MKDRIGRASKIPDWQPHYGKVTNMKQTLARAPAALHAYMEWYRLRDEVVTFLGERATNIYVHAISTASDCLICSTYFRKILIEAGEDPDRLELDNREVVLVELGRQMVSDPNRVSEALLDRLSASFTEEQIVLLVGFGGIMIATNIFNNVLQVELDDYLVPYRRQP